MSSLSHNQNQDRSEGADDRKPLSDADQRSIAAIRARPNFGRCGAQHPSGRTRVSLSTLQLPPSGGGLGCGSLDVGWALA